MDRDLSFSMSAQGGFYPSTTPSTTIDPRSSKPLLHTEWALTFLHNFLELGFGLMLQNQVKDWAKKAKTYHREHGLHQSHRHNPAEHYTRPGGWYSYHPGIGTGPDGRSGAGTCLVRRSRQHSLSVHHISTIWGCTCTKGESL